MHEIDGVAYTTTQILDDAVLNERWRAIGHAERYPDGCGEPGHRCEACHVRLDERMHTTKAHKVGARPGYRGHWEYACTEPGCGWER